MSAKIGCLGPEMTLRGSLPLLPVTVAALIGCHIGNPAKKLAVGSAEMPRRTLEGT
jgi:hypothetical protein